MRSVLYRRWSPAQSPVAVEFLPEILHEIRVGRRGKQDRGYLFGRRQGEEVRVEAAVRTPHPKDPRLAGLEPVGIYVVRTRGEVFLTDADLEQAERVPDGIALAVVGGRAGFFPREANGSIQAVRSHEEFLVADAAPQPEAPEALYEPRMTRWLRHPALPPVSALKWAAVVLALLGGPMAGWAYWQPDLNRGPLELSLEERNGQLMLKWDPADMPKGGSLEISEGALQMTVSLAAHGRGVTYESHSGDVEFRVKAGTRVGMLHWRSALPRVARR